MYDRSLGDDDDKDEEVEEDAMFQSSHVRSAGEEAADEKKVFRVDDATKA